MMIRMIRQSLARESSSHDGAQGGCVRMGGALQASLPALLASVLLVAALCGCAGVTRYERGPLVAFGEFLDGGSEPLFYLVNIDPRRRDDARVMTALVKFGPAAPPMALGSLRPETVAPFLPCFSPPPQWPLHMRQKALENDSYEGGGFNISFREGRLVSLGICSHCAGERHSPVVGTPDGQRFHALPLTMRQVEDVFGPAFTTQRVQEVRYGP